MGPVSWIQIKLSPGLDWVLYRESPFRIELSLGLGLICVCKTGPWCITWKCYYTTPVYSANESATLFSPAVFDCFYLLCMMNLCQFVTNKAGRTVGYVVSSASLWCALYETRSRQQIFMPVFWCVFQLFWWLAFCNFNVVQLFNINFKFYHWFIIYVFTFVQCILSIPECLSVKAGTLIVHSGGSVNLG